MAETTYDREWMRRIGPFYPGLVALGRLTIVPLPRDLQPSAEDLARSAAWFSAVGLLLGLALALAAELCGVVSLSPALTAIVVALVAAISTRALHETALATTVEMLAGAPHGHVSRAAGLSAPDDSAAGYWGIIALVAVLALRAGGLMSTSAWWAALLVSQAAARWAMPVLAKLAGRASHPPEPIAPSTADWLGQPSWTTLFLAGALTVALPALVLTGTVGLVILAALGATLASGRWLLRRTRSATESSLAAVACACELVVLLAFAAARPVTHSPWVL